VNQRSLLRLILVGVCCATALVAATSRAVIERTRASDETFDFAQSPLTRPRTVGPLPQQVPGLGPGASLQGKRIFPPDNPWNQEISNSPLDPNSANLIASIGVDAVLHPDFGTVWNGAPNGIPYVVVSSTQPLVPVTFRSYGGESDPGPYPVPRTRRLRVAQMEPVTGTCW